MSYGGGYKPSSSSFDGRSDRKKYNSIFFCFHCNKLSLLYNTYDLFYVAFLLASVVVDHGVVVVGVILVVLVLYVARTGTEFFPPYHDLIKTFILNTK